MTDRNDTLTVTPEVAALVGTTTSELIRRLAEATGEPENVVLWVAHAHVVAMIASRMGAGRAVEFCQLAAEGVSEAHDPAALALARATPAGRA